MLQCIWKRGPPFYADRCAQALNYFEEVSTAKSYTMPDPRCLETLTTDSPKQRLRVATTTVWHARAQVYIHSEGVLLYLHNNVEHKESNVPATLGSMFPARSRQGTNLTNPQIFPQMNNYITGGEAREHFACRTDSHGLAHRMSPHTEETMQVVLNSEAELKLLWPG